MLGTHAGFYELVLEVDRVRRREVANTTVLRRSACRCQWVTMSPTSSERSTRSASSDLDVVALTGVDAFAGRGGWGVDAGLDQKAEVDELLDLRRLDHGLERAAEAAAVAPAGRCRQADDLGVGIGLDDLAIGSRAAVVRFVDHHDVGQRQSCLAAHTARPQRLY